MDIFFSSLDRSQVYKLPIIPENMPELSKSAKNEEFEGDGQTYNILGNVGLVTFTIDSWMPEYAGKCTQSYCKSQINPYLIINLWSQAMIDKKPIRCVQTRNDGSEILNWLVSVENMSRYPRQNEDIKYKIEFKEYVSPEEIFIDPVKKPINDALNNLTNAIKSVFK